MTTPELVRLDPESEACFEPLTARIATEIAARMAMGDDPSTPEGSRALAELIADTVLDGFVVRTRTQPRYRWGNAAS